MTLDAPPEAPEAGTELVVIVSGEEPTAPVPVVRDDTSEPAADPPEPLAPSAVAPSAVAPEPPEEPEPPEPAAPPGSRRRVGIHPRFRARRVAVVRERGRRRLRALVVLMALVGALLLAWLIVRSPILDVDHVDVEGTQRVPADEVRAAARVHLGAPMLFVDLGAVERRVEQLPWVGHATASRDWLDRIRVTVTERTPATWVWRAKDRVTLLDATGRVLGDAPIPPDGVPELRGVRVDVGPGHQLSARDGFALLRELPAPLRGRLVVLVMDRGAATLELAFAPDVRLGAVEDVGTKLAAAQAVIDHVGTQRVHYIDVRVPDAPTTG
ncbi:MAG: FtsQ-type POTRA domain-containing protein [Acidimicrobiia bacterium]